MDERGRLGRAGMAAGPTWRPPGHPGRHVGHAVTPSHFRFGSWFVGTFLIWSNDLKIPHTA